MKGDSGFPETGSAPTNPVAALEEDPGKSKVQIGPNPERSSSLSGKLGLNFA